MIFTILKKNLGPNPLSITHGNTKSKKIHTFLMIGVWFLKYLIWLIYWQNFHVKLSLFFHYSIILRHTIYLGRIKDEDYAFYKAQPFSTSFKWQIVPVARGTHADWNTNTAQSKDKLLCNFYSIRDKAPVKRFQRFSPEIFRSSLCWRKSARVPINICLSKHCIHGNSAAWAAAWRSCLSYIMVTGVGTVAKLNTIERGKFAKKIPQSWLSPTLSWRFSSLS